MKDEIKAAFEKTIAGYDARAREARQEQERKLTARQQFEADWHNVRDAVVVPALNEVVIQVLQPQGWLCQITSVDKDNAVRAVRIEVSKGNQRAVGGQGRPHLEFTTDAHSSEIMIYAATQSQGGADGGKVPLSAITGDLVQQHLLKFFQRLTSEWQS